MQEVAKGRMAGCRVAWHEAESRARRQETKNKEKKTRSMAKSKYSGVEQQGETKLVDNRSAQYVLNSA